MKNVIFDPLHKRSVLHFDLSDCWKKIFKSKCVDARYVEEFEIMGKGRKTFLGRTKTKELMEYEVECKDGITSFGSLICILQGCYISASLNITL